MSPAVLRSLVVIVLLVGQALPGAPDAGADEGPHAYGDMVHYPMVFPLAPDAGQDYWYADTFYAPRAGGDHHAQDLMTDKMVPVVAVAAGTVEYVNWNRDSCCSVTVVHDDGWESWYIHLNNDTSGTDDGLGWGIAPDIVPGVQVQAGQLIGWVGDSGNAEETPPHLHFELRDPLGVIVNPYEALLLAEERVPEPAPTGYGEMVEYPMVFPLAPDAGQGYWYTDTFWDARPGGEHRAQDLMTDKLVPVVAVASGWVEVPDDGTCCSITVVHDDGWESRYLHLNNDTPGTDDGLGWGIADTVFAGAHVEAGELLGWVGDSGEAEHGPPHLHFELRDPDGVVVNPYEALRWAEDHDPRPTCNGEYATILDTNGDRVIIGSDGRDVIVGTGGDDYIDGGGGDDLICGMGGADTLVGGDGDDHIIGGPGNDSISGGTGGDVLKGNGGADTITGGPGADKIRAGAGDDVSDGEEGWDRIFGQAGNDRLLGSAGNDRLVGMAGSDELDGGEGDDRLVGGAGVDTCLGEILETCEL
jgi:murein DD-endopeptidase MepM/ murein hydrolase activator NlpD